jgi:ketosteroid isomerase-like protein
LKGEKSFTAADALRRQQELYQMAERADSLEERLVLLEAEREVRDHVTAYPVHYDARDLDRLVALFADDAVLHNILGTHEGGSEIRENFEFLIYHLGESMHFLSNLTVRIESPGRASASCYLHSIATRRIDGYGYGTCGTYTDRLVRSEKGWKITERRGTALIPYDLALTPASYDRFQASRETMPQVERQP